MRDNDPSERSLNSYARPRPLAISTGLVVTAAAAVLLVLAASVTLQPDIALHAQAIPEHFAVLAGMASWLIFGLAGGSRAHVRPLHVARHFALAGQREPCSGRIGGPPGDRASPPHREVVNPVDRRVDACRS